MVKPIPDGYHSLTPYLVVNDASRALAFYTQALGAKEMVRLDGEGGRIMHAEFQVGNSMVMIADENPQMNARGPKTLGGSPVSLMLYVENVDESVKRAVAAGATLVSPVADQFYGDRTGTISDPFGYSWHIATHIEDVQPEEMQRRMDAMK